MKIKKSLATAAFIISSSIITAILSRQVAHHCLAMTTEQGMTSYWLKLLVDNHTFNFYNLELNGIFIIFPFYISDGR